MINLRETCVFPLETQGLYSTARVHNFFRPGRNGNSVGSEVTHRPMAAEINRCRLASDLDGRWPRARADSRLAPIQWETSLQSNAVSHWLGANLESTMQNGSRGTTFSLLHQRLWNNQVVMPRGRLNIKTIIGIPIIKIRGSHGRLIFIMEISIPGKMVSLLRRGPGVISVTASGDISI